MLIDIHIPTDQGPEALNAALEAARESRLDGVVLTWRGPMDPSLLPETPGLEVFHAAKILTEHGPLIAIPPHAESELNAAGWPESNETSGFEAVTAWCREQGWALILTQPFMDSPMLTTRTTTPIASVDAVEVTHGAEPLLARDLAIEAALGEKRGIVASGGGAPQRIGRFSTLLLPTSKGQSGLVRAIRQGAVWVVETGIRKVELEGNDGSPKKRGRRRRRRKPAKSD